MKSLLLAILGAIVAWLLIGLFFKDYEVSTLFTLIIGTIIGYNIGKQQK
ncbi:hypothetical protein ACFDTO_23805 [Microbacteriaceae bacterium 4G12]